MKLLLLAVILVAGTNAGLLTDIGTSLKNIGHEVKDTFEKVDQGVKTTGKAFVPYAKNVAIDLLKDAAQSGVEVLSNTVTDMVGQLFNKMFHIGRDTSMIEKLVTFEQKIKAMIGKGVDQFAPVIHGAFERIEQLAEKVKNLDFDLPELEKDIEAIVLGNHFESNEFLKDLMSTIDGIKHEVFGDRATRSAFTDSLANIRNTLTDVFKPALQTVHNLLGSAGEALKTVANNVVSSVQQSVSALGEKLAPHLLNLKNTGAQLLQHGNNALSAIKEATGDIIGQTLSNVGNTMNSLKDNLAGQ